jgi:hypothetical protein
LIRILGFSRICRPGEQPSGGRDGDKSCHGSRTERPQGNLTGSPLGLTAPNPRSICGVPGGFRLAESASALLTAACSSGDSRIDDAMLPEKSTGTPGPLAVLRPAAHACKWPLTPTARGSQAGPPLVPPLKGSRSSPAPQPHSTAMSADSLSRDARLRPVRSNVYSWQRLPR